MRLRMQFRWADAFPLGDSSAGQPPLMRFCLMRLRWAPSPLGVFRRPRWASSAVGLGDDATPLGLTLRVAGVDNVIILMRFRLMC
jgi:hypothetical protein